MHPDLIAPIDASLARLRNGGSAATASHLVGDFAPAEGELHG